MAESIQDPQSLKGPDACAVASAAAKDSLSLQDAYFATYILSQLRLL